MDDLVAVIATAIGSAATAVGVLTAWLSSRSAERVSAQQSAIAAHATAETWLGEVRRWATAVIETLSEASYSCKTVDPTTAVCVKEILRSCRCRLSALIDQGRYFFPNQRREEYGVHKPLAYRGYRHAVLDPVVAVERLLGRTDDPLDFAGHDAAIVYLKREFVSRVFRVLSPETHNEQVARMIRLSNATRANDPTLGGLFPEAGDIPTGADPLLNEAVQARNDRKV
jgi:hypothetical protein